MTIFYKHHHELIRQALSNFNSKFFEENRVFFGGGTRIALELNEYRESIDIDFLCPDRESYRAVREQVTEKSLNELVKKDFLYPREIRADRDAVRCFIEIDKTPIKLEFVSFADYQLSEDKAKPFVVPALDKESCYLTKLLANADRYNNHPFKDIFDILAMFDNWGDISQGAWQKAYSHYGFKVIFNGLKISSQKIFEKQETYVDIAIEELDINCEYANHLIYEVNSRFIDYVANEYDLQSSTTILKTKLL